MSDDIKRNFNHIYQIERENPENNIPLSDISLISDMLKCEWCGAQILSGKYYTIYGETICEDCLDECSSYI